MGLNSGATYLALFAGTLGFGAVYATDFYILPLAAAALMLAAAFSASRAPRHSSTQ